MPSIGASPATQGLPPRTVRDMITRGRDFLVRKGRESARLESELLCAHALGLSRLELFMAIERPVELDEVARARELLVRRGKGEPVAYITGKKEFYGREFRVAPGVLVPRSETELLVDLARERLEGIPQPTISEFGTGSGCIAITLALELDARVRASDISSAALEMARANAESLGASVEWLQGGGLELLVQGGGVELFCSNPPYIDPAKPAGLDPAVAAFEPAEALFTPEGRPDHWVRAILESREALVKPGGTILVELGFDQAARVRRLAEEMGLDARLHADLEGVERALEVRLEPA